MNFLNEVLITFLQRYYLNLKIKCIFVATKTLKHTY